MGITLGRKSPSGLVFAVDAANDRCQSRNIFQTPNWATTGEGPGGNTTGNFDVDGTGDFTRLGYGQTFGGYTIKPEDVVYRYDLGVAGCHYKGWDFNIGNGTYTFAFDYYVSPDAANFPTTNLLANLERRIGGSVAANGVRGVWQTVSFGGSNSGVGLLRPLMYPGACSNSFLASSGFILYKNPRVTVGNSLRVNDFDQSIGGRGGTYTHRYAAQRDKLYDICSGRQFDAVSSYGRPLETGDGGGSWEFDAGHGYWTCPGAHPPLDNQRYSIEVWIKTDALSQNGFWFEKGTVNTQYALFQEGGSIQHRTRFTNGTLDTLSVTTASFLNTTDWFHIVATYDGTTKRTYINGVERNSKTINGTVSVDNGGMWIGVYGNGAGYQYDGKLAKCNVYNRAITATEVKQNFDFDKARFGY